MNYVFRYIGSDPRTQNQNRFFYEMTDGMPFTVRGGLHAPKFSSEVINIEDMAKKLGPAYRAELWTPALLDEPFYKTTPPGWWIAPALLFGLPTLLGLAIWLMSRH
jgi:hypothetical protein